MECELERATIYCKTHGEGIPLLTLHGFPLDHRAMKGCLEPIFRSSISASLISSSSIAPDPAFPSTSSNHVLKHNFKRIYFDLPGMGRTKLHDDLTSSDDIFNITTEFIDTILPDTPFLVAGNSYGGYLARGLIKQRPQQVLGLLLICPLIKPVQSKRILPPRTILHRDPSLESILSEDEQEEFDYGATNQTEEGWIRYQAEILSGVRVAQLELLEKISENSYPLTFDVDALEQPFEAPSLFLLGKQDSVVGYEDALKLADLYPGAEMIVVDKAAHSLEIEQPDIFNEHVIQWLDRFQNPHSS